MKITKIAIVLFLLTSPLFAQINFGITDTASAYKTEINIPLKILSKKNIRNYSFDLLYDESILKVKDIVKKNTLCDSWAWHISMKKIKGGVRISGNNWWTSIYGKGVLLYLKFSVIAKEGKSDLIFSKLKFNNTTSGISINNGIFLVYVKKTINFNKTGTGNGKILINNISYSLPKKITLLQGKTYKIKAIPDSKSNFISWQGDINSNLINYSLLVNNQKNISTEFQLKNVRIEAVIEPEGYGIINGLGFYSFGSEVVLVANPNSGKDFKNWTINDKVVCEKETYKFIANKNLTVKANFASYMFNISATPNPIDIGIVFGNGSYEENENIKIIARSNNKKWSFNNWTENGIFVSSDSVLNITVKENRNLVANFSLITNIDEETIPDEFFISAPYPNPFNPSTTFKFCLTNNSVVNLFVTNVTGQVVKKIIDYENMSRGVHKVNFSANNLASGVYFYFYEIKDLGLTEKKVKSGKLILIK
ncbi:MAG: hypothetical protein CR986_03500 [Ignavibacteriae bacterium]|nr:MAG: hypothetical protein CR986_03500 [Ignavibacteriota bacterium]